VLEANARTKELKLACSLANRPIDPSSNKLVRAHADKEWVTKLARRRQLHAAHFDDLADQCSSRGFSPEDFALGICETGAHSTPGRCDVAQPAAVLALALNVSGDENVVSLCWLDFDPMVALTKDETLVTKVVGALEVSGDGCGRGIGQAAPMKAWVERGEAEEVLLCN
jgi:hypothetical protein